jgi:hypothetical protein
MGQNNLNYGIADLFSAMKSQGVERDGVSLWEVVCVGGTKQKAIRRDKRKRPSSSGSPIVISRPKISSPYPLRQDVQV